MKLGIVSRPNLREALDFTKEILDRLSDEEVVLDSSVAEELGMKGVPVDRMDVDSLITIGGDGTVLYAQLRAPEIPVLGINMGGRGFLAEVEPEDAFDALDRLVEGELEIIELIKLAIEVSSDRFLDALNEGVVRVAELGRTFSFKVLVDGVEVEETKGDGLIVATTTGTTAYALAAGGPVVDPRLEAFVVVPLSAHRPRLMPLVLPTSSEIEVEVLGPKRGGIVIVDGQVTSKVKQGDKVLFRRSENKAKFYKWAENFYEKAREKL